MKETVSNVLLGKEYDQDLYDKLVNNNFELFRNKLIEEINGSINVNIFNKLVVEDNKITKIYEINKFLKNGDEKDFLTVYKNLSKDNKYIKKINYIWKKYNNNGNIKLEPTNIKFIETNFNGNQHKYLLFIIPRITKLNLKQLDILIPEDEEILDSETESSISIEEDEITKEHVDNNTDIEYIRLLELNINNLQSNIQNIQDTIVPKMYNLELRVNESINKLETHEIQTKRSLEILEDRISKLLDILTSSKL